MIAVVTLIIWFGNTPSAVGQYETKEQCWQMVEKLLEHGVGADKEFAFQCIDPREELNHGK